MQSRNRHLFVTDLLQSRVLLMNGFPSYHLYALLARKSLAKDSSMKFDLCREHRAIPFGKNRHCAYQGCSPRQY